MYVGLKVFHDVCIILYTCKSSLYFILVLFLVVVHRGPHGRLASFLLNVLPSENKDYYYYYYYYYFTSDLVFRIIVSGAYLLYYLR